MIATDGLFYRDHTDCVAASDRLGGWEVGGWDEFFACQAGVYAARRGDTLYVKSRGFYPRDVIFDRVQSGWAAAGPGYTHNYETRRFVGLGVALARKDFSVWRTWPAELRALSFESERKVSAAGLMLPTGKTLPLSAPYVPKRGKGTDVENLQAKDQPLRNDA